MALPFQIWHKAVEFEYLRCNLNGFWRRVHLITTFPGSLVPCCTLLLHQAFISSRNDSGWTNAHQKLDQANSADFAFISLLSSIFCINAWCLFRGRTTDEWGERYFFYFFDSPLNRWPPPTLSLSLSVLWRHWNQNVTESLTEWQRHLFSCAGQLKIHFFNGNTEEGTWIAVVSCGIYISEVRLSWKMNVCIFALCN